MRGKVVIHRDPYFIFRILCTFRRVSYVECRGPKSLHWHVAQLVRAMHRNRRAAGSIPARESIVVFFATALG